MRRNRKKIIIISACAAAVIAFIFIFMKFLNGNFIYFSAGFFDKSMIKTGGQKADRMEVMILMSDTKKEYEKLFGSDAWGQTVDDVNFDDYAKEQVKSKLSRILCMNNYAKEKGVALSRSQKDGIDDAVDSFYGSLNEQQIKEFGVTKDKLKDMFTKFAIAQTIYNDMTDSLEIEVSSDEARVIAIQYICADSEEAIKAAKERVDNGEIFYVVAKEINGDEYECQLERGVMDKAFEDAAFDLRSGETSGIVEANGKYYIIKCNSDNEKSKTEANKVVLTERKRLDAFNEQFEKYEADQYVEVNKRAWKKLRTAEVNVLPVNFEEVYNQYLKQ